MDISLYDSTCWEAPGSNALPASSACESHAIKFNAIFAATKDRLYHFVWKMTQNETDVKDILQNCYIRFWQKMDTINTDNDVLPLLFTYARNLVIDHLRKKARQRVLLDKLEQETSGEAGAAVAEQQLSYKERLHQLQASIEQLPARRKQIFHLVKQEGLSHKTVADQLGISPATVEKQVGLSLRFLRKEMDY